MATVPRLNRYYQGATTSCSARPSAYWFASRLRVAARMFVFACALPTPCRPDAGPGSGLFTLAVPLQRSRPRARTGSPRFPGSPSRDSAPVHDPGRPFAPRRWRCCRCCPQIDHTEGVVIATIEAYRDASSPAVYASRRALPHAMQDSLPAGGLRLCRAGVEPAGALRKVSDHIILLPRTSPGARSILDANFPVRGRVGGVVTELLPSQSRACRIPALGSSHVRFAHLA